MVLDPSPPPLIHTYKYQTRAHLSPSSSGAEVARVCQRCVWGGDQRIEATDGGGEGKEEEGEKEEE